MKLILAPAMTALALALLLVACDKSGPGTTNHPVAVATNSVPVPVKADWQKLLGRWERPDGGYILEFLAVDAAGKLDAHYSNPAPINVESAAARMEAGFLEVFVVLRDVNYPGCTYQLTYDAAGDRLTGQYFQAAQQQTYDIYFERQK